MDNISLCEIKERIEVLEVELKECRNKFFDFKNKAKRDLCNYDFKMENYLVKDFYDFKCTRCIYNCFCDKVINMKKYFYWKGQYDQISEKLNIEYKNYYKVSIR